MNIIIQTLVGVFLFYLGLLFSTGTTSLLTGNTTFSFVYRCLVAYGSLALCAVIGVIVSTSLRIVGQHRLSQWIVARSFKYSMLATTGVRFRIIGGQEHLNTRPAIFIGNHQTALDVLLLGEIFPKYCSVVAKKQLKYVPFLGWFMALSATVFVDRANRKNAVEAMTGAAKEIGEKKQSVFIFPEGTRSNACEPTLLPFKKGAFHLAIQAKAPIIPVIAGCYQGVLSLKEWRFRRGEIPVIGNVMMQQANSFSG